jgi:cephalosporin hydroxylase
MAAAYQNEDTACVGIEDYSEHPDYDRLQKTFTDMKPTNAWVCEGSFQDVIPKLKEMKGKVGVFYYDGNHSHENTLLGLYMALPLLAPHSYIIIDDMLIPQVKHAKQRFVDANDEWTEVMCHIPERQKAIRNTFRNWLNGICILERK